MMGLMLSRIFFHSDISLLATSHSHLFHMYCRVSMHESKHSSLSVHGNTFFLPSATRDAVALWMLPMFRLETGEQSEAIFLTQRRKPSETHGVSPIDSHGEKKHIASDLFKSAD